MIRTPVLAALLVAATPALAQQEVAIRFAAQVNGSGFACGQSYTGLGSTNATATPTDFPNAIVNDDERRKLRAALYRPLLALTAPERSRVVDKVLAIILDGAAEPDVG